MQRRLELSLLTLGLALAGPPAPAFAAQGPGAGGRQPAADAGERRPFVRVVGSAQDGGFPHTACHHPACREARESGRKRLVASVAIVLPASGRTFLVDATPDLAEQLELLADVRSFPTDRVDRAPIDGIFLTHAHIGHYLGLAQLGFEAVHSKDLPVYCTPRMADFLRSNGPWSQLVDKRNIELVAIELGTPRELGEGVSVTAVRSPHRDEFSDTVGFVIAGPRARILYLPDTDSWQAWSAGELEIFDHVDLALVDGTFFSTDELPGRGVESIGHPLIAETMRRFARPGDGGPRILFTHLNHSNPALVPGGPEAARVRAAGFGVVGEGDEFGL